MKITYDAKICIHAGNCVNSLPTVFKVVEGHLVIDQQGASATAIRQTVAACPSGTSYTPAGNADGGEQGAHLCYASSW